MPERTPMTLAGRVFAGGCVGLLLSFGLCGVGLQIDASHSSLSGPMFSVAAPLALFSVVAVIVGVVMLFVGRR